MGLAHDGYSLASGGRRSTLHNSDVEEVPVAQNAVFMPLLALTIALRWHQRFRAGNAYKVPQLHRMALKSLWRCTERRCSRRMTGAPWQAERKRPSPIVRLGLRVPVLPYRVDCPSHACPSQNSQARAMAFRMKSVREENPARSAHSSVRSFISSLGKRSRKDGRFSCGLSSVM